MSLDQGSVTLYKKISNMPSNKAPALGVMNPLGSRIAQVDGFNEGVFFAGVKPPPPQRVELFDKKEYKKDAKIGLKGKDLPKKFSLATGLLYEASGEQATSRISQITGANRALRMFNNPTMAEYILGRKLTPEEIMRKSVSGPFETPMEPAKRLLPAQDILDLRKFLNQNLDLLSGATPVDEEKKSSSDSQPSEVVMTKEVEVPTEIYNEVAKYEGEAMDFVQYREKIMNAKSREELQSLASQLEQVLGTTISEKADDFISNNREFIIDYMKKPVEQQQAFKKLLRDVGLDLVTARRILTLDSDFNEAIGRVASSGVPPATAVSAQPPVNTRTGKEEEEFAPPTEEPPAPVVETGKSGRPLGRRIYITPPLNDALPYSEVEQLATAALAGSREPLFQYLRSLAPAHFDKFKSKLQYGSLNPLTALAWVYAYGGISDFNELDKNIQDSIDAQLRAKVEPVARKQKINKFTKTGGSLYRHKNIKQRFEKSSSEPEKDVEFAKDRLKILVGSLEAKNRPNKRLVDEAGQLVQYLLLHKAIPKSLAVSIMNKVVNLNTK